jgi:hypothetical protein
MTNSTASTTLICGSPQHLPTLVDWPYFPGFNSIDTSSRPSGTCSTIPWRENQLVKLIRPWKILRTILFSVLTWFFLAFLWAYLPSPSPEPNNLMGRHIPRPYFSQGEHELGYISKLLPLLYNSYQTGFPKSDDYFNVLSSGRHSLSLSYTVNPSLLTLSISSF